MDELLFRISQTFEAIQVRLALATDRSKGLIIHGSEVTHQNFQQLLNSELFGKIKEHVNELWFNVLEVVKHCNLQVNEIMQAPIEKMMHLIQILKKRSSMIDNYSLVCGLVIGVSLGVWIGLRLQKKQLQYKSIKSVVCNDYSGVDQIVYVDDVVAPSVTRTDHVLIQVKASGLDRVDFQICNGYGQYIRKYLHKYYSKSSLFPITLGRSCSGLVVDIGCRVNKVEVGDEVWVAVPVWCPGTLGELIVVKECFVGKKPSKISYEGAASLSYSGSLALECLESANLNSTSALNKQIFIENCVTPVGCVLTQVLKQWGAVVTTTSSVRAAPVAKAMGSANNIINTLSDSLNDTDESTEERLLAKELELRKSTFDVIFITGDKHFNRKLFQRFLNKNTGPIICALPKNFMSDNCGYLFGFFICLGLRMQYYTRQLFSVQLPEEKWLDILFHYVENEQLQSVVDHIYPAQNVELAVAHKMSTDAIGNTIVKFN